jgi:hypothetical protein
VYEVSFFPASSSTFAVGGIPDDSYSNRSEVKRSGRDEPMRVVIHMCMEAMLGISLYSYLHLKLAKTLCVSHNVFSPKKSENKRVE